MSTLAVLAKTPCERWSRTSRIAFHKTFRQTDARPRNIRRRSHDNFKHGIGVTEWIGLDHDLDHLGDHSRHLW
jgi:hypothetical protein